MIGESRKDVHCKDAWATLGSERGSNALAASRHVGQSETLDRDYAGVPQAGCNAFRQCEL